MVTQLNPFRPTAGADPPQLVGRTGLLDEFEYGLRIRSGAPGLLTIFTGARGVGKTVMLGEAEDVARRAGWAVISETATRGFLGRIGEAMRPLLEELGSGPPTRRITGLGIGGFSVRTELPPEQQADWRQLGEQLLKLLDDQQTGLAISLDEIHGANRDELAQLAASVQHFIRARLPVALVFAGLPAAVSDLLDEGVATFLRRADRIDLHATTIEEVEISYQEVLATLDHPLSAGLVRVAAEATGALASASRKDVEFLRVMAQDEGPSKTSDIGRRLGNARNTVGNYRARLIDAGLIDSVGHGLVNFAIPGMRDYLRS